MSTQFTPYTNVTVILKQDSGDTDLSQTWSTIEYEDGLPQNLKITLNASFGRFMTKAPIIQKFDKIFVKIEDARGNVISDVFHVRKIKRSRNAGKNKQLTLFCPHQSDNLWTRTISLVARRTSGFEALNKLMEQLNQSQDKGSEDPDVEVPATFDIDRKVGNLLDPNTSNNYIFEAVKLQTATDEIRDIEQQPVEGGGSFEAVFIRFKSKFDGTNESDINIVQLQAFPQGFQKNNGDFTNIPNVTLIHQPLGSTAQPPTNILTAESDEDPELATNLHVVSDRNSGSYLVDWNKYQGAKDVFNNAKFWDIGINYLVGNLVNNDGIVFECIVDNLSSLSNIPFGTGNTFWTKRDFVKPQEWVTSTFYPKNQLVRNENISWKAVQAHTSDSNNEPPNSDFWQRVFFAPAVDYSPLTKANTQNWVNALAGAKFAVGNSNAGKVCMIDPNVIILDQNHPRTFVRTVREFPGTNNSNLPQNDLLPGNQIPDGYRVLALKVVDNIGTNPESGPWVPGQLDRNGVEFAGNILEFRDPNFDGTGQFFVFKAKVTGDDQEVFDYENAIPWVKNPCNPTFNLNIPDRYVNNTGSCVLTIGGGAATRATTWIIGSYGLSEIPLVGQFGVFFDENSPIGAKQMECAHSVKTDTTANPDHIDMGTVKIIDDDIDGDSGVFIKSEPTLTQGGTDFFPFYVGFNFHSLWPVTKQNDSVFAGTPTEVGEIINLPTFDFNNMFRDHRGGASWFGPNSEDFLPIQSFAFWLQFLLVRNDLLNLVNLTEGDFSIGIWLADRRDNVRIIELTQSRKDDVLAQEGKLPGQAYKGVPGVSAFFAAQQPDTTDAFDPREFLIGGIYTKDSFDAQGRYLGVRSRYNTTTQMEMRMDGYRMIKPLLVTNADTTNEKPERNIGTQLIKKQGIVSYAQAKNLVLGLDRIFNFERREFIELTGGRADVKFGDSVYYTDSEEINDTTDDLPNTVKGVNTKNVISLSKGKNGPGGFTSKFHLVTRIWP